jgi:hypothetical protein
VNFRTRTYRRWMWHIALGLAVAAVVAPAAEAILPSAPACRGDSGLCPPAIRFAIRPANPFPTNSPYKPVVVSQPEASPVSTASFHWGDAAVGIGIGAGFVLLVGAGVALGRRRGRLLGA